jgi:prepilin-type N-terminal cleavage/methylation domain-containing protein
MCSTSHRIRRREAFTLIELIVVVAVILTIAALAAAFVPSVSDNTNLSRAVDLTEQVLLTAKLRAKRDQLATGVRFIQAQGDAASTYSQFQYIQQPDPLAGGWVSTTQTTGSVLYNAGPPPLYITGGIITSAAGGTVTFANVDFSLGGTPSASQWLVQPGDFLEVRDGGVYMIGSVVPPAMPGNPANTLLLVNTAAGSYDASLTITTATTNYRILRQPRLLTGEAPVALPNNFAVDFTIGPSNVQNGPSGFPEILFSPTGAVIGTNAGTGKLLMVVHDVFANPAGATFDSSRAGIVGVQGRTGFIAAYEVAPSPPFPDIFSYVEQGRTSGGL